MRRRRCSGGHGRVAAAAAPAAASALLPLLLSLPLLAAAAVAAPAGALPRRVAAGRALLEAGGGGIGSGGLDGGVTPQIVGGVRANITRLAHQLYLSAADNCGASLLAPDVAVTAAHCIYLLAFPNGTVGPTQAALSYVVAGTDQNPAVFSVVDGAQQVFIRKILVHPLFDMASFQKQIRSHSLKATTMANDVALLFFQTNVTLSDSVRPIKIATAEEVSAAQFSMWYTSGFGSYSDPSSRGGISCYLSPYLRYGCVNHFYPGNYQCKALIRGLETSMQCAGGVAADPSGPSSPPKQDSCSGDSGGPLAFNTREADDPYEKGDPADDRLAGITSWGDGCGKLTRPGVYTNLVNYKAWVECEAAAGGTGACDPTPGNVTWLFDQISPNASWSGDPQPKGLKLLTASQGAARCMKECSRRAGAPPRDPRGCSGFSIVRANATVKGLPPARYCRFFGPPLQQSVCGAGEEGGLCGLETEGSWSLVLG